MNTENFEIGDSVEVVFCDTTKNFRGIIRNIPRDVGDMWHIETKTILFAINPICHDLRAIIKGLEE